jgi:hypothetical protein
VHRVVDVGQTGVVVVADVVVVVVTDATPITIIKYIRDLYLPVQVIKLTIHGGLVQFDAYQLPSEKQLTLNPVPLYIYDMGVLIGFTNVTVNVTPILHTYIAVSHSPLIIIAYSDEFDDAMILFVLHELAQIAPVVVVDIVVDVVVTINLRLNVIE